MHDTQSKVLEIVKQTLPIYNPEESLNSQLSSLEIFGLIPKIERAFKIEIFSAEISIENLYSTATLAAFIDKKLSKN